MKKSRMVNFFYLIHDLTRQMRRWQEKVSQEFGLTMPQLRAIAQLCDQDGVSQTELAQMIDSDPMTVSGVVERLEAKGLVRRAPHPSDSRAKIVLVTDKARIFVDQLRARRQKYEPFVFEGISADEMHTTLSVLQRVSANVSQPFFEFEEVDK